MTKTLLRIDASIRQTGSCSRALGDYFVQKWLASNPGARVMGRDVHHDPVPHLNAPLAGAFFAGDRDHEALRYSNRLCDELIHCTHLLLTCPMYNFGIPSTLKAYLDHVVRIQETFRVVAGKGYDGLLKHKKAYLITARGGRKSDAGFDAFEAYLTGILAFMGIADVETISIEGTQSDTFSEYWPGKFQQQIDQLLDTPVLHA